MDKLKRNTEVIGFTIPQSRKIIKEIIKWCTKEIGMKPRLRRIPELIVTKKPGHGFYGEYHSGSHKIKIYLNEHNNLRRLINTVIHEFTHSCQKFISVRYEAASKKHGYNKNPFEVEARKIAKENQDKCLKHLRKKFG